MGGGGRRRCSVDVGERKRNSWVLRTGSCYEMSGKETDSGWSGRGVTNAGAWWGHDTSGDSRATEAGTQCPRGGPQAPCVSQFLSTRTKNWAGADLQPMVCLRGRGGGERVLVCL